MSSSDERFENMMKEAIAPNIEPDKSLNEKIITGAFEPKKAKVSSLPRLIAVAAIVVALGSAGVYAGVQIHKKLLDVNVKDSKIHIGEETQVEPSESRAMRKPLVLENFGTDVYETYDSYDEAVEKTEAGLVFSETYQLNGVVDINRFGVGGDTPSNNHLKAEFLYKDGSFVENYKVNHGYAVLSDALSYANACNEREYVAPNDFVYTLVDCELYTYMGPNDYLKETGTDVAIYYNYRDSSNGEMLCSVECDLFFKNLSDEDIYHILDTIILPEEASQSEDLFGEEIEPKEEEYYLSFKDAMEQTGIGLEFSEDYQLNGEVDCFELELDDLKIRKMIYSEFFYKDGGFTMACAVCEGESVDLSADDEKERYVSKNGIEFKLGDYDKESTEVEFVYMNKGEDVLVSFTFVGLSEDEIHHVLDTVIVP